MVKMERYRCVNYNELCRLCTNSSGTKVSIFSEEGKKQRLYHKIIECLPVHLDENDKLPKIICTPCMQQVETIAEFRETCINAQNMLESCLDSPKYRNGGKVYVKDVINKKPTTVTNSSNVAPTMQPNTLTVTKTVGGSKQTVSTTTPGSDLLSSIIQAVGIQNNETKQIITQPPPLQAAPQYTLTFDGQTVKANQIQYKIEEPTYTITEMESDNQSQASLAQSVNEFLKLNNKSALSVKQPEPPKMTAKVMPPTKTVRITKKVATKPNINLVLTTPPKQAKPNPPTPVVTSQPQQMQQIILPIQIKEEGKGNYVMPTTTYLQMKVPAQFGKIDGQQTTQYLQVTPQGLQLQPIQTIQASQLQTSAAPANITYTTSSTGNTTNITPSFRISTANAGAQTINAPKIQTVTIPASSLHLTTIPNQSSPIKQLPQTIQIQTIKTEPTARLTNTSMAVTNATNTTVKHVTVRSQAVAKKSTTATVVQKTTKAPAPVAATIPIKKEVVQIIKPETIKVQVTSPSSSTGATTTATVTTTATPSANNTTTTTPTQATTCEICGKLFKRKEFLVQHMKLHIGLRPFKCTEHGCNKSFTRKEHLLRHIVSHTGKKMFSCELCQKFFSRKDNLNKHKRTHPEYANEDSTKPAKSSSTASTTTTTKSVAQNPASAKGNNNYVCEVCSKVFAVKHYYMEHKKLHESENKGSENTTETTTAKPTTKKVVKKENIEILSMIVPTTTIQNQHQNYDQQQQVVQQQQQHHQQQQQQPQIVQIRLAPPPLQSTSSSGATKTSHDTTVLTLPSGLVLNSSNFITGEMIGNYKIE